MIKKYPLGVVVLILFFAFSTTLKAQCGSGQANINGFYNTDGSVTPDASFTLTNSSSDTDVVRINSNPVRFYQGVLGDVQIFYREGGSTYMKRYYEAEAYANGTDTYTNFFLRHGSLLYHSKGNLADSSSEPDLRQFKPYQTSNVIGTGTEADPIRIRIKFYADVNDNNTYNAGTDILVTKTVSYVAGEIYVRSDYVINNPTGSSAKVYEARDEEFPGNNDNGWGMYSLEAQNLVLGHPTNPITGNITSIANAEKRISTESQPEANARMVGFSEGRDGTQFVSWYSDEYSAPYYLSTGTIRQGQSLGNIITREDSDIGFVVQLSDATSNATTKLVMYEMAALLNKVCAEPYKPVAYNDNIMALPNSTSTTSVLENDLASNYSQATTSNVTLTQVSTTNPGISLNPSGTITVASGVSTGTYTITYRICDTVNTAGCSTATIKVSVPVDSDGDNIADAHDLDSDNDGILDAVECAEIVGTYPNVTGENSSGSNSVTSVASDGSNVNNGVANIDTASGLDGAVNSAVGATANYNIAKTASHVGYNSTYYLRNNTNKILVIASGNTSANPDVFSYKITTSNVTSGYKTRVTISQVINISNFVNEAGDWVFTWDGGGEAIYYDDATPTNTMYVSGAPPNFNLSNREIEGLNTKGVFTTGNGFRTYNIKNSATKWRVVFPAGATNIVATKTALAGGVKAGPSDSPSYGKDSVYPKYGTSSANNAGETSSEFITFQVNFVRDTDNDGVPDCLDLDSDGDSCFDAIEGGGNFTPLDIDANGRLTGTVGNTSTTKGVPVQVATGQAVGNSRNAGTQSANCGFKLPMITQTYKDGANYAIEVTNRNTNPSFTVPVNKVKTALFSNSASTAIPSSVFVESSSVANLAIGQSLLIKSSGFAGATINSAAIEVTNSALSFTDATLIGLTTNNTVVANKAYEGTYDVVTNTENKSSKVRVDYITLPNRTYVANEWVVFVDDAKEVYGNNTANPINTNTQRHYHAPLLSEVKTANVAANNGLGLHKFGATRYTGGAFTNGAPDRSRGLFVDGSYDATNNLSARVLSVTGTSKLSITDKLLVVSDSVSMDPSAEIRLLGQKSQLIQTHNSSSKVYKTGKLLKDQHSNINVAESIYRYNYWSSPVRNSLSTNTYTVEGVMKDGTAPLSATSTIRDINFSASTYNGDKGTPITIANYWIRTYYNGKTRSNWVHAGNTNSIDVGKGYAMKGTGATGAIGQNYTFIGSPNDGNYSYAMGGDSASLLGNPYAGTMDANVFLLENSAVLDGTLYFWEHTGATNLGGYVEQHGKNQYQGGYSTRNLSMGVAANTLIPGTIGVGSGTYHTPSRYIATAQGFFVSSNATGGNIRFSNKQRATDNAIPYFMKSKESKASLPILKIGFEYFNENNLPVHRQLGVSFSAKNSFKYDYGFDSPMLDTQVTDVYWNISELNTKSSIIGVGEVSKGLKIPIGILVDTHKDLFFMIDEKINIKHPVYLLDSVTGLTYNLSSPVALGIAKGEYENRFYLTFEEQKASLNVETNLPEHLTIVLNSEEQELLVSSKVLLEQVKIYDLLGKEVLNWSPKNKKAGTFKLNISSLSKGNIYIIKVKSDKGTVVSKKVF